MPPKTSNRRCAVCGSRLRLLPGDPSRVCSVCHEPVTEPRLPPMDPDWPWDTDSVEASNALGARYAKSRTAAAIWGHLVGDAIGVPYEFSEPDPDRTVELRGGGRHGQPPGTWSDDGALMLALLDSLASAGFDPDDQARRILAWIDAAAYTPDADGLFDIGNATFGAVDRLKHGVPATDAGGAPDTDEQGNGSLMRILPLALVGVPRDDAELVERAHLASRVTHGALPCQVACALYVLVARDVRPGVEPEAALAAAVERLRAVYLGQPAYTSVLDALLAHRSHLRKPGGGWVLDSFWSAWDAFAAGSSYRDAIVRAVRLGHDTDTTAAIAGGLAGLRWGLDERDGGIPRQWLGALRGREIVEGLLRSALES